jgi:hypothetical protein
MGKAQYTFAAPYPIMPDAKNQETLTNKIQ